MLKCREEGFPGGSDDKESARNVGRPRFNLWVGKILWRKEWLPTPVFLPGEFHGSKGLAGSSPWGRKESDKTEGLNCFSLKKKKKKKCREENLRHPGGQILKLPPKSWFFFLPFFFWPCHMGCGLLVPQSGIEPAPPTLEMGSS